MITLIKNLLAEKTAFGSIIKMWLLTLLVLTICTCSGVKLMSVNLTSASQTDYSTYSGRLVRPIIDPMVCATSRIDGLDFHLWHQEKLLIWRPYQATLGLGYYQNLALMPRRCLLIRWYQYPLITRSFSNRYRTVWTGQRQSLRTEYQPVNSRVKSLKQTNSLKSSTALTQRSTGKTQATTRTTVRSSSYLSTTRAASGSARQTSSTTGALRRRR